MKTTLTQEQKVYEVYFSRVATGKMLITATNDTDARDKVSALLFRGYGRSHMDDVGPDEKVDDFIALSSPEEYELEEANHNQAEYLDLKVKEN